MKKLSQANLYYSNKVKTYLPGFYNLVTSTKDLFTRMWEIKNPNILYIVVRWLMVIGLAFRLWILNSYSVNNFSDKFFQYNLIALGILFLYTLAISCLIYKKISVFKNKRIDFAVQIGFDLLIFATIFILAARSQSDIFLSFFLPLIILAENFKGKKFITGLIIITFSLVLSIWLSNRFRYLFLNTNFEPKPFISQIAGDIAPRVSVFIFFALVVLMRSQSFKRQAEEMEVINKTLINIPKVNTFQRRLEAVLLDAKHLLDGEGAVIFKLSEDKQSLEIVALEGDYGTKFAVGYKLKKSSGIAWRVLEDPETNTVVVNDYKKSPFHVPEFSHLFDAAIMTKLILKGNTIGVLGVYHSNSKKKFSKKSSDTLERLASYAAVGIYDKDQEERVNKQLDFFKVVSRLRLTPQIDEILTDTAKRAFELAKRDSLQDSIVGIALIKKNHFSADGIAYQAAYPLNYLEEIKEKFQEIQSDSGRLGITGRTVAEKRTQWVPDVGTDPDFIRCFPDTNSELCVPIKAIDNTTKKLKVIGVISIESARVSAFSEELIHSIEIIADQAGSSIEISSLLTQVIEKNEKEEKLRKAFKIALSDSLNELENVGDRILLGLKEILSYESATIQRINDDTRQVIAKEGLEDSKINSYLLRAPSEDPLIEKILAKKDIYVIPDVDKEILWEKTENTARVQSWIGIPLVIDEKPIGFITIDSIVKNKYQSEAVSNSLKIYKDFAASILQNGILFKENLNRINDLDILNKELTSTKEYLETLLNDSQGYGNLALIGLIYGESIHYARDRLGLAKSLVLDIEEGLYGFDPQKIKEVLFNVRENINKYLKSISDAQRKILSDPVEINLQEVIKAVIDVKKFSSVVSIEYEMGDFDHWIYAPPQQLRQVFFVVIQNAFDSIRSQADKMVKIQTLEFKDQSADFIQVFVTDSGKGIPIENQANLFKPKRSSDDAKRARMGLPWTYSFLRSYGGNIQFTTSSNGTTMKITVPKDFRLRGNFGKKIEEKNK